jgi:hypothetical protein
VKEDDNDLKLEDAAPDFEAETTEGVHGLR